MLDELLEQTGGRRDERYRTLVEEGARALARVQKWSDELTALIAGRPAAAQPNASFDAVRVVQVAAARMRGEFAALGIELEVLVPARLPRCAATARASSSRSCACCRGACRRRGNRPASRSPRARSAAAKRARS